MAPVTVSRSLPRFMAGLALAVCFGLAGCVTESSVDDMDQAQPVGSPFDQALYKNYSYLAHSFGVTPTSSATAFDAEGSMSLGDVTSDVADLADQFAQKALSASRGENVIPEPAPDNNSEAQTLRLRLLKDLDQGSDKAPVDAARAQADFDCWIMNGQVRSQAAAAGRCRRSLDDSLAKLERDLNPAPPPPPVAATAPSAPAADFTVYFDFDSWTLTAEDLTILTQAIDTARAGGQSRITVVGHTDTSGSVAYNQRLSVKRAGIVKEVMVQMGARPEAIQVSGVGKTDLAVQTGDGVREPKNRRSVITLAP
jgi:outer membrane protein OmpA-like peptidoglycan-associated protein